MADKAIFSGLVFDENDVPVSVTTVGNETFYVVNDQGFLRHISSKDVDRQVWELMIGNIQGHEDVLSEQAAKMLGQEDIFTVAMIQKELKDTERQFDALLHNGIPEESKAYFAMMGFRVTINVHGEVINFNQPGITEEPDE